MLGIICECGCNRSTIVWTRQRQDAIERSRECDKCGKRMSTTETLICLDPIGKLHDEAQEPL